MIINEAGRAAGDAHLRTGRARAAREEVHEDRVAGARGDLRCEFSNTGRRTAPRAVNRKRHADNAERVKLHVTKGDTVRVMRGDDKGKEGKVIRVYLKTGRVLVEGVNIVKKHRKARDGRGAERDRRDAGAGALRRT